MEAAVFCKPLFVLNCRFNNDDVGLSVVPFGPRGRLSATSHSLIRILSGRDPLPYPDMTTRMRGSNVPHSHGALGEREADGHPLVPRRGDPRLDLQGS